MCTGRPPFRAETSYGTLSRICEAQPTAIREINPDIPEWLVAIIEQLHQKNPDERFQTAQEVAHLLEQCLAHLRQPDAVGLPAGVLDLTAKRNVEYCTRRAAWHSDLLPPLRRAVLNFLSKRRLGEMAAAVGAVALAIGIAIAVRLQYQPAKENPPVAVQVVPRVSTGISVSGGPIQTATQITVQDDDVAREIEQLKLDIDRLEGRTSTHENTK
jgi:hypothetical protein